MEDKLQNQIPTEISCKDIITGAGSESKIQLQQQRSLGSGVRWILSESELGSQIRIVSTLPLNCTISTLKIPYLFFCVGCKIARNWLHLMNPTWTKTNIYNQSGNLQKSPKKKPK